MMNVDEIVTTPTHPFYVPQKGWTSAAKLRAGDVLVLLNGEYAVLEQIQHELLESPIQVYNFQVEDFHTYYVGDTSVLVHNTCEMNSTGNSPNIGNKTDYMFGKATGSQHNIDRSMGLLKELNRIGINDTASGRQYVADMLTQAGRLVQGNGRQIVETMLYGPVGGTKMTTIWEFGKLITIYLGKG